MDKISKYITYDEATFSQKAKEKGLKNIPNDAELEAMKYVATEIFDKCREFFKGALGVNSFFRSKSLNAKIKGASTTSRHCKGEAIDINATKYGTTTNAKLFLYIVNNLEFDQVIWEYGTDSEPQWVHVSKKKNGVNRNQILKAEKVIVTNPDKTQSEKVKYFDITEKYKKK